jgi:hypothetical protein
MNLRFQNRNKLLVIGSWLLALGNIWHWFGTRMHFSDGVVDGAFGLLMGMGIATLLLSIRSKLSKCETRKTTS